MSPTARQTRELAARESDGIHVLLLWHPRENALTVSVEDARLGDRFQLAVAPDRALDAFYHPFAHAAYEGRSRPPERRTVMFRTNHGNQSHNLAARMGRWSADHWKTATFGWLAFVLVAFALGGMAGTKTIDPNEPGPGESGRMDEILDEGFKQPAGESVLIESESLRVDDPAFAAVIEDVVRRIETLDVVQNVRSPLDPENSGQIAPSGHAALVEFEIRGDADDAADKIGPVLDRVDVAQQVHPEFFIGQFGDASAVDAVETAYADDLAKAGELSLPITLIILVIAFGALVAAGIPLLLALTAVFATFGLVALSSHFLPMAMQAPAVVLLIGLAVGVDYSMFYLKREREERATGRSTRAAVEAAAATSGRSVLVSGLVVMTAMAGMFLTGNEIFASIAVATIAVVAMAVLGSLTVLPALLSRFGDGVDRLRVPLVGRLRRDDGKGRIWGAIVDRVMRRPALWAVVSGGALVALAIPAFQLHLATPPPDTYPRSIPAVETYVRMQEAFPGTALPANVVVKAPDVNAPAVQAAIQELEERALASGRMHEPITVEVNDDATVANITVPMEGDGEDAASRRLSRRRCGTTSFPRPSGPCRKPRPVSRVSRPSGRTRRTRSSRSCRSCSRSCSCSHSWSCSSPSARS